MNVYITSLQEALENYHNWLSKKRVGNWPVAPPAELRGIFYNKLISALKTNGTITGYGIRKSLFPTDFSLEHELPGAISKVKLVTDSSHVYHNSERKELLLAMKEALDNIDSNVHYNSFGWKLDKIIKSLKA